MNLNDIIEQCKKEIETQKSNGKLMELAEKNALILEDQILEMAKAYFEKHDSLCLFNSEFAVYYTVKNIKNYELELKSFCSASKDDCRFNTGTGQDRKIIEELTKLGWVNSPSSKHKLLVFSDIEKFKETKFAKYLYEQRQNAITEARKKLYQTLKEELKVYLLNNPSQIDSEVFYFKTGHLDSSTLEIPITEVDTREFVNPGEHVTGYCYSVYGSTKAEIIKSLGEQFEVINYGGNVVQIIKYTHIPVADN